MKQLLSTIKASIYNPTFYQELLAKPFGYSWKYYSALALLVALFLTIVSSIPLVIVANKAVREFPQKFFEYYPDELELIVTNGVLRTNVAEPYLLPVPLQLRELAAKDGITAVAVIDTTTPFSLEQFSAYQALVWVGSNQFAYRDDKNSVRLQRFEPGTNVTINEALLRKVEGYISPYYSLVGPIIVVSIFIGVLVALGINFIYLLFAALLILLLGHIIKKPFTYVKAYQIGLHAITLPLLVQMVVSLTPVSLFGIPFVTTIFMLIVVYANYTDSQTAIVTTPMPIEENDTSKDKL